MLPSNVLVIIVLPLAITTTAFGQSIITSTSDDPSEPPRRNRLRLFEQPCRDIFGVESAYHCTPRFDKLRRAILSAKRVVDDSINLSKSTTKVHDVMNPLWAIHTASEGTARELSYFALILQNTARALAELGLNPEQIKELENDLRVASFGDVCQAEPIEECAAGGFRAISGYCNNVKQPMWGSVFQAFGRLAPPVYEDGISVPRSGVHLPDALTISSELFDKSIKSRRTTASVIVAQWALFIYNDMAHIGASAGDGIHMLDCCHTHKNSQECFSIKSNVKSRKYCVPYSRTLPALSPNCSLEERQQANQATSFLDGSMIYGSTRGRTSLLRSFTDGKLKVSNLSQGQSLLPQSRKNTVGCNSASNRPCFLSGTNQVNLMPTLSALHTVWVLQHNRVAESLKVLLEINRFWDDEKIFRETRKIVGAQIQHITFNEFLPVVLGWETLRIRRIGLRRSGFSSDYDINLNPATLNEFSAAAGLFFYSMFPENMTLTSSRRQIELANTFYNPDVLYEEGALKEIIRFLSDELAVAPSLHASSLVRQFLKNKYTEAVDLVSIIIQMGRDHGLPSYNTARRLCGQPPINSFDELREILQSEKHIPILKRLYKNVDDIDLFAIGMAEKPAHGSLLGPTFACVIAEQFTRVQKGDRYWYENFFYPSSFRHNQLNEIRKTTLARILCDNVVELKRIQPQVFLAADNYENSVIQCSSSMIETLYYTAWADVNVVYKLPITEETIKNVIRIAEERVRDAQMQERRNQNRLHRIQINPHVMRPSQEALDLARTADVLLEATKIFINEEQGGRINFTMHQLDVGTLQELLPKVDVRSFIANATGNNNRCNKKFLPCDSTLQYRTITGWCNNLKKPDYGVAFSPFRRLLSPLYDDGFSKPRSLSVDGSALPSARKVANVIHQSKEISHKKYSHLLMSFGQFLDHDMTHTPMAVSVSGQLLECSSCDSQRTVSSNCLPIAIPPDDPYFPSVVENGAPRCMNFIRSVIGQLKFGYREQLNQLTSFIDASNVYGSNDCSASDLRLFQRGKLNYTEAAPAVHHGLPFGFKDPECQLRSDKCFIAGDIRVNENSGLIVPHILFVREHNRLADKLYHLNTFWSDEKIYQETRRIIGAILQHITFKEWLPKVLGNTLMDKYDLHLLNKGYSDGYDKQCDPTISNEFATAAFRFGHTLVRESFLLMHPKHHGFVDQLRLKHSFFNMTLLHRFDSTGLQMIATGLLRSPSMAYDRYINQDLRNHLFEIKDRQYSGLDLPALNIQRGRDHGIQGYNAYREYCGHPKAVSFSQLYDVMDEDAIEAFGSLYKNVNDIDLFPGLISERPMPGALVGPTLGCIIGEQMKRLKKCDRFWYENDIAETRFTPGQLDEIRKVTLAKLICNNMGNIKTIQPSAFDLPDNFTNAEIDCDNVLDFDVSKWMDRSFCIVNQDTINVGQAKDISPCVSCTCTKYGAFCQAKRIESCPSLMEQYRLSEIEDDTACLIQCSGAIAKRKSSHLPLR